jgi:hypothetical protein
VSDSRRTPRRPRSPGVRLTSDTNAASVPRCPTHVGHQRGLGPQVSDLSRTPTVPASALALVDRLSPVSGRSRPGRTALAPSPASALALVVLLSPRPGHQLWPWSDCSRPSRAGSGPGGLLSPRPGHPLRPWRTALAASRASALALVDTLSPVSGRPALVGPLSPRPGHQLWPWSIRSRPVPGISSGPGRPRPGRPALARVGLLSPRPGHLLWPWSDCSRPVPGLGSRTGRSSLPRVGALPPHRRGRDRQVTLCYLRVLRPRRGMAARRGADEGRRELDAPRSGGTAAGTRTARRARLLGGSARRKAARPRLSAGSPRRRVRARPASNTVSLARPAAATWDGRGCGRDRQVTLCHLRVVGRQRAAGSSETGAQRAALPTAARRSPDQRAALPTAARR